MQEAPLDLLWTSAALDAPCQRGMLAEQSTPVPAQRRYRTSPSTPASTSTGSRRRASTIRKRWRSA